MVLRDALDAALQDEQLLPSAHEHLTQWLDADFLPAWAYQSLDELATQQAWSELNDRFFRSLAFGTGGMRSRTIGRVVTDSEQGQPGPQETPEHAAVGANMLNDFNVIRATLGLFRYAQRYLQEKHDRPEVPRLVIAHDVRHFSRHFAELAASTWSRLGGYAMLFDGPRSTPQLSFTVRATQATAGIVITASHNPAHDNGYKVYFDDGAQVVYPHAEGIIHEVNRVAWPETRAHLDIDLERVVVLPVSTEEAYHQVVKSVALDPELIATQAPKIVFSPIHGTGGVSVPRALTELGAEVVLVDEQMRMDPRFPTVASPNPENAPALKLALEAADACQADVVLATDPDADRMGAAVRGPDGQLHLLSGNVIGALLAEFRIRQHIEKGWLPKGGSARAALIKTFVTTPLQAEIARQNGLKVIDTLTGFKWIGEKLRHYETELVASLRRKEGIGLDYEHTAPDKRRALLLEHSTYYVFGGEESYGYLASDAVRDKDANAACVLFAELAADLKQRGLNVLEHLDALYIRYGFYQEGLLNLYYEGAEGSQKIRNILESYRANPPQQFRDFAVTQFRDFGEADLQDADGKAIPKQDFYFVDLDNGYQVAVRGSGTEPKIKFYLFAREHVSEPAQLATAKQQAASTLAELKAAVEADARKRAEG